MEASPDPEYCGSAQDGFEAWVQTRLSDGFHHLRDWVNEIQWLCKARDDTVSCGGIWKRGIQFRHERSPLRILHDRLDHLLRSLVDRAIGDTYRSILQGTDKPILGHSGKHVSQAGRGQMTKPRV